MYQKTCRGLSYVFSTEKKSLLQVENFLPGNMFFTAEKIFTPRRKLQRPRGDMLFFLLSESKKKKKKEKKIQYQYIL